jgi:hypothetical protein
MSFAPEQPDLNWDNREVRADFLTTLGSGPTAAWTASGWTSRTGWPRTYASHCSRRQPCPTSEFPAAPTRCGTVTRCNEIYAEWRGVFNEYDPPRMAVAEACCTPSRLARYASPEGLGQAFNFDLLEARWRADDLRQVIDKNLPGAPGSDASPTWVLSNHDVVRHATRYGLPQTSEPRETAAAWLRSQGTAPTFVRELGARRAARCGTADTGPTRVHVHLPGRGARAARGGGAPRRRTAGPGVPPARVGHRRAATDAEFRCPGHRTAPRSASATVRPTCRNRNGSDRPRSKPRRGHLPPLCSSTVEQ